MKKIKRLIFTALYVSICFCLLEGQVPEHRVAIVGDYGNAANNSSSALFEKAVAEMIFGWYDDNASGSLDAILSLGDNNYNSGAYLTAHQNIGAYYSRFIAEPECTPCGTCIDAIDDIGAPCTWATPGTPRMFWPSLGNHDYNGTDGFNPYLDYFDPPGNGRYYDFTMGEDIHFFVVHSENFVEPDGATVGSIQADWLQATMAASDAKWKIVYFHSSPYSSATTNPQNPNKLTHNTLKMQWPFQEWGADIVISADAHIYERFDKNCLPYVVNGLGGKSAYPLHSQVYEDIIEDDVNEDLGDTEGLETIIRHNYVGNSWQETYGAMLMEAYEERLNFKFVNVDGGIIDEFDLLDNDDPCNAACLENEPLKINTGTHIVWDDLVLQSQDVIIESGASLTITGEVRMATGRRFVVKRGARMVVDGGTITNLCDERWRGIYVWGNAQKIQPEPFGVQATDDAGILILQNNALLEHAEVAVIASASGIPYQDQVERWGGLVWAENTYFYDNEWAAQFMKYDSLNKSKFYKCHFLEEGDYYDGTIGVSMWACNGITFEENIFENLDGFGIMGIDHSIKVINNNSFLNNRNGIESYASTPFSVATTIGEPGTTPNYFLNNEVHILAEASGAHDGLNIYGNTLNDAIVGIYIDGPTQYNIIDNAFYGQSLGILSRQSGDYTNFIDCNEIQNVEMGIMVEGRNRFTQIRGNCFVQSAYNIWLTSDNGIPGQIRFDQGDNSAPAINSFSQNNIYDIYAPFNSTLPFRYFVPFEETDLSCNGSYLFPNTLGNYQTISTPYKGNFCSELEGRPEDNERPDDDRPGEDRPGRGLVSQVQDALQNADFDLVEALLKKDNSAKAKQWLFGIKLKTNDYSSARKVLHELPVNTEEDRIFKAIQKINLNFRTATEPFLLNASEETFLYDVAYSTSSMKGYARALLILLKGERFDISLNLPKKATDDLQRQAVEDSQSDALYVYPNPAKDNFSINYQGLSNKRMNVEIFNTHGKHYLNQALDSSGTLTVSTIDFPAGIYFVNVSDAKGILFNTRVLVVK